MIFYNYLKSHFICMSFLTLSLCILCIYSMKHHFLVLTCGFETIKSKNSFHTPEGINLIIIPTHCIEKYLHSLVRQMSRHAYFCLLQQNDFTSSTTTNEKQHYLNILHFVWEKTIRYYFSFYVIYKTEIEHLRNNITFISIVIQI